MMKTGGSQPERPVRRRYQIPLVVILSAWLGVSLFVWYSANVTFSVLSVKNNPGISERFSATPEGPRERALRRTAGEINRGMFHGWNRVQLAAGALLLGMMMLGGRSGDWFGGWGRVEIFLALAALTVVGSHVFWLGPGIDETGKALAFAGAAGTSGAASAAARRFGLYHGVYVESDLIKAGLLGGILWFVSRGARPPGGAQPHGGDE